MLLSLWSPKGGAGTSVFAAACALVLSRQYPVRLADLGGDQPAILGLSSDPAPGLAEWLAAGLHAPAGALDRIAVNVAPNVSLLPRGEQLPSDIAPEAGAALGVVLANEPQLTIADVSHASTPALQALVEVSDVSVVVVRDCYVALRRALRHPLVARASGAIVMDDEDRALGANEVRDVLGLDVFASVPLLVPIARVVDAGVLATRLPRPLEKAAMRFLARVGLSGREGRVA
ncbi:MAG: ATPase involved in chromosome partitioning [Actinomycetia bacterium]|nr:ATPase involved in chromosome partitioning [Actinomycetes bacterium]